MILAFKQDFVPKIKEGSKIHTIREDKPNRWKKGNTIHFATGVRTKNYNQFHEGKCTSVQQIKITYPPTDTFSDIIIEIDGIILNMEAMQTLAYNDGFKHLLKFCLWFSKDFKGKIIHWTDFEY